jgi:hypothetical protein
VYMGPLLVPCVVEVLLCPPRCSRLVVGLPMFGFVYMTCGWAD